MITRTLIYLALATMTLQTVRAEETDPPHVQFWKALEGNWNYKLSPGDVEGKVMWRVRTRGNTLAGWFTDSNGVVSSEVSGWQADSKVLCVNGFGDGDNYWQLRFSKVTATSVEGTAKGARPDGVEYEGTFVGQLEGENVYKFTIKGKTKEGEPLVFKGVFNKEDREVVKDNWKCPWKWLLGTWDVKRSDGTTASVHWKKPRADAELLYGTWKEANGSVLNETIGWHADSQMLVAHAYGAKGEYFWVRFNEVGPDKMTGFFGSRDAKGEAKRGTVEIERVGDEMAKSKLIESDGTVVTETFTLVKK